MDLTESELDRLIESHLAKDLDANIVVPDIDKQWQKIKQQILSDKTTPIIKKPLLNRRRIVAAAAIILSCGSLNFFYPTNANAVGGKIAGFFNYIVGKTTQNRTQTYKQGNDPDMPQAQNVGANKETEVTLDQAQASIPFKLATPSYLPLDFKTRRIVLTSFGADIYQILIEYNHNDQLIVYSQQNSGNGISRGSLFDTDDTIVKDLIVNGNPAMMFMSKNGINKLNWQIRGLVLEIKGEIAEDEIIKIAKSIN